jgi:hypothetical protein
METRREDGPLDSNQKVGRIYSVREKNSSPTKYYLHSTHQVIAVFRVPFRIGGRSILVPVFTWLTENNSFQLYTCADRIIT